MNNELNHHGILGQKWGVRRYQNKDGSLTPAGRERVKKLYSDYVKTHSEDIADKQKRISDAGVVFDNSDYIKKGSILRRYSTVEEKNDSKRKYVSLTDNDSDAYRDHFMETDKWDSMYLMSLSANKKLKVANGKTVVSDLVDKYGDKSIKDVYEFAKSYDFSSGLIFDKSTPAWASSAMNTNTNKLTIFLRNQLTNDKRFSEISNEYSKKGYDAIVDAEDFVSSFSDYPVILLNPGKSTTIEGVLKLY